MKTAPEVAVGTVWFVWGEHQIVRRERMNLETNEREVMLVPVDKKGKRPWVADWRVARKGNPSVAFSSTPESVPVK